MRLSKQFNYLDVDYIHAFWQIWYMRLYLTIRTSQWHAVRPYLCTSWQSMLCISTAHLSSSLQMHRLHASGVCVLRSPSTHLHFSASDVTATGVLRPKDLENGFYSQGRWVSDGDKNSNTVKEAEDGDERSKGRKKNRALNLSSPQAFSYTEERAAFSLIELASAELSYRKYSRVHGGIPALARVLQNPNDLWDNKE